jgi:hypothetical protein
MQRADPDPDDKNLLNRQRSIPNTGVEIQPKAGLEATEKPAVPVLGTDSHRAGSK